MSVKTTVNSFVKQFSAALKGDDAKVMAEKAFRQASSALKTQISSLEGDTIQKEDKVTDAQEALNTARINNAQPITDRDTYISTLLSKKNNVTNTEAELEKHLAKITFLKDELKALEEEVEA